MRWLVILMAVGWIFGNSTARGEATGGTAVFQAAKDTWLRSDTPDANSDTSNLRFGFLDPGGQINRSILHFDLTGIWGLKTVTSGTLTLYCTSAAGAGQTAYVRALTRMTWVESQATWNSYATSTAWTVAGGDKTDTGQVSFTMPASNNQAFDITGLGTLASNAIASASGQLHIILMKDELDEATIGYTTCRDSEWTTASQRPYFTLGYTV